jgi:predicted ATP-dependent protease
MPIGGMKQKLTGALAAGVKTVFVPQSNYDRDLEDVPEKVRQGLTIIPVKDEMEVLKQALVRPPQPLLDESLIAGPKFADQPDTLQALVEAEVSRRLSQLFTSAALATAKEPANDVGQRSPAFANAGKARNRGPRQ